jgi:DNA helicase-2/ATP-dependent DNA helicase PcrA
MLFEEYKEKFNIRLNAQQEKAVLAVEGPTLLLAVPGSGKTTVIVARLGYMLHCKNIDPKHILTMTYTVSATRDMRARYAARFGAEEAEKLEFRTINGVCARIIKRYERERGTTAFELTQGDGEGAKTIAAVYRALYGKAPSENDVKEIQTLVTYAKNMLLTAGEIKALSAASGDFSELYAAYVEYLKNHRKMDYDDQLRYARTILKKCPDILAAVQNRYRYLCVDEAQDTSKIQHELIRELTGRRGNIFMVGDEDQSIYGFRAAYPKALLDFERSYAGASVLLMEQNYRSTKEIVSRANTFIRQNISRFDKNMHTENEQGKKTAHTVLKDLAAQYAYLLRQAKSPGRQTAVLYRNNDSALPLINALDRADTAYRARGLDTNFFTNRTVTDIVNILRFAANPADLGLFSKLYAKIGTFLTKEKVAALQQKAGGDILDGLIRDKSVPAWQRQKLDDLRYDFGEISGAESFDAIRYICEFTPYKDTVKRLGDSGRLTTLLSLALQSPGQRDFIVRLSELKSLINTGCDDPGAAFILSTIHSSKGLEYDKVILIDIVDGVFPSVKPPEEGKTLTDADAAVLEEERRIFYVGATRAKKELELVTCKAFFGVKAETSSFVKAFLSEGGS